MEKTIGIRSLSPAGSSARACARAERVLVVSKQPLLADEASQSAHSDTRPLRPLHFAALAYAFPELQQKVVDHRLKGLVSSFRAISDARFFHSAAAPQKFGAIS